MIPIVYQHSTNTLPVVYQYMPAVTLVNTVIILYLFYRLSTFNKLTNRILTNANNWMSYMGSRGAETKRREARERITTEGKTKLVNSIAENVPFGARVVESLRNQGMNDTELFTMVTDPDVLRGMRVLADFGKGVTDGIAGLIGGEKGEGEATWEQEYQKSLREGR